MGNKLNKNNIEIQEKSPTAWEQFKEWYCSGIPEYLPWHNFNASHFGMQSGVYMRFFKENGIELSNDMIEPTQPEIAEAFELLEHQLRNKTK